MSTCRIVLPISALALVIATSGAVPASGGDKRPSTAYQATFAETRSAPPTKKRLETDARALHSISRTEPPTLRRLLRRLIYLIRRGAPADIPAITWFDSAREQDRALDAIRGLRDPKTTFLLIPGSRSERDPESRRVRRGSFFAGLTKERTLLCARPIDPEPQPC